MGQGPHPLPENKGLWDFVSFSLRNKSWDKDPTLLRKYGTLGLVMRGDHLVIIGIPVDLQSFLGEENFKSSFSQTLD